MVSDDVDEVIEKSHLAWGEYVKGNPEPAKELFSHNSREPFRPSCARMGAGSGDHGARSIALQRRRGRRL